MALQNKQIGWSQESNLLWEVLKQVVALQKTISTITGGGGGATGTLQEILNNGNTAVDKPFTLSDSAGNLIYVGADVVFMSSPFYTNYMDATAGFITDCVATSLRMQMADNGFSVISASGRSEYRIDGFDIVGDTWKSSVRFTPATANRDITFKNESGIVAYTSDLPQIANDYVNDAAAAIGGIAVGGLYHTAGIVKIRLT